MSAGPAEKLRSGVGLEHELGFGGWPHPAAVPLSSLPPEHYQALPAFLSIAQDMLSGEISLMLQPELQLWKHGQPGFFWYLGSPFLELGQA